MKKPNQLQFRMDDEMQAFLKEKSLSSGVPIVQVVRDIIAAYMRANTK